jgi:hypothetical protein
MKERLSISNLWLVLPSRNVEINAIVHEEDSLRVEAELEKIYIFLFFEWCHFYSLGCKKGEIDSVTKYFVWIH